ncbi:GNAT family N-acetyltransferase [Brevundimonas sp. A19_0]|uniref:GNAT family N-acetyltransferase n=1 Tax=Brevundimonas sp. A19_0 TaxID=2821087 RepID=UPI001ADD34AB|nr:GNAT family N-acetyltransferase [Brevundimonas sp. A19_0]MBO9501735.1 GNAT family N-acetyltransferase [Brevundimonas sp. A19_0]
MREGDAEAMAGVYERAVRDIGARYYSAEQVVAWVGQGSRAERFRRKITDGRRGWVAVDQANRVTGFADLEADGHIDLVYVDPAVAGQGVATLMLDELENAARSTGITRLFVEASEPARRMFERRGYTVTARRDFEIGGVAIHNYAMERTL